MAEIEALRSSVERGTLYGNEEWMMRMAKLLRQRRTLCTRSRRRKAR